MVRAEAGAQKFVDAFQIRFDYGCFAAGNAPSDAPSGCEVVFRQASESDDWNVGRDRGHGYMRVVVDDEFVVDFVGEDYEVVLARQVGNLLQHFPGADGAGGIVGIDQDDPAGAGRDLLLQIVEIGLPAVVFVQVISVEADSELRQNGRVERIVGAGRQQVVAGVEERGKTDVDGLAHARGDENVLNAVDALAGGFGSNCAQRLFDARRRCIAVFAVAHGFVDGFDHVGGRFEIESDRIADIQRDDLVTLVNDFIGDAREIADGVADLLEAGGGG